MDEKALAPGLYLVATPIGNLEDITLRALRVLRQANCIACEDTRQTQKLLNHFGITTPTISYHMHNEVSRSEVLIERLHAGERLALVSDAGTPGIADPGEEIVAAAVAAGLPVFAVPGANAALAALVPSGLPADRFDFHGFLPAKPGQRRSFLETLERGARTHILYESPHRVLETLADLASIFGPAQHVVLARELTKLHEEFLRGTVSEVRSVLAARDQVRGEFVLLLRLPEQESTTPAETIRSAVNALMASDGISEMDALKRIARERGIGKSEAYRELQRSSGRRR